MSSFGLVKLISYKNSNKEEPTITDIKEVETIDNTISNNIKEETINTNKDISNSYISNETITDLKDNLGKGTNGGVNKVDQTINENGEKEYIFHYEDGNTQTITIVNDDSKPNIEVIDPNEPIQQQEDTKQEDSSTQEQSEESSIEEPVIQEEDSTVPEPSGTVYERYLNMSSREKYAFYKSFESQQAYLEWYRAAQAEYLALHPTIEVGSNQKVVVE